MAVKGKRKISIYVDGETYDYVSSFLETTKYKGGMSAFMNAHLETTAKTLKASRYVQGKKMTVKQLLKFAVKGAMQEPV